MTGIQIAAPVTRRLPDYRYTVALVRSSTGNTNSHVRKARILVHVSICIKIGACKKRVTRLRSN